ncbi:MAG: hypothetical protein MUO97_05990 [Dehalococcoidia bacterium]|nr:hypothetical protein [Dehalococcoidia bacterium]
MAEGNTGSLGTEAADYEAEFSQSGARAVIASAEKLIEKATAILGIIE